MQAPEQKAPNAGLGATGFNPAGTQNAPNANPALPGGVGANQLAADNRTLDKLLWTAIELGNPEGVRSALTAGANMKMDYAYFCSTFKAKVNPEQSLADEALRRNLNDPKVFMTNSGDTPGDAMLNYADPLSNVIPTSCARAHMAHAFQLLFDKPANFGFDKPHDRFLFTSFDPAKVMKWNQTAHDMGLDLLPAQQAQFDRRLEILFLLDANTPAADKAFYPLYIRPILTSESVSSRMAQPRQWAAAAWLISRYLAAAEDIKKARALHEPARLAWDKLLSSAKRFKPMEYFDYDAFQAYRVAGGAAAEKNGPDPMLGMAMAELVTKLMTPPTGLMPGANFCQSEDNWNKAKQAKNPDAKEIAGWAGVVEFNRQFMYDYANDSDAEGLSRTSPQRIAEFFEPRSRLMAAKAPRHALSLGDYDLAVGRHGYAYMMSLLRSTPEIVKAITEYPGAQSSIAAALGLAANAQGGLSSASGVSGGAVRTALADGMINPATRDSTGQTPTDRALSKGPDSATFKAFTMKDFKPNDCQGNPVQ